MFRKEAIERLEALETVTSLTANRIVVVRDLLVSRPESGPLPLLPEEPIPQLMESLNHFLHCWRSAPLLVRPLPVCFGRLRGVSYAECMAAMVWDLALSIGVWLEHTEIGTPSDVHLETVSAALTDYSTRNGLDHIQRPDTSTPVEVLGLAVTGEILSERQRCLASSTRSQFESNERRRAETMGTVTLWHYAGRANLCDPQVRPQVKLSDYERAILDALDRMGSLTQCELALAVSHKEKASGKVKQAIAATVLMGLVSPGRKGRGSSGYRLTDSGKALIEGLKNGAY